VFGHFSQGTVGGIIGWYTGLVGLCTHGSGSFISHSFTTDGPVTTDILPLATHPLLTYLHQSRYLTTSSALLHLLRTSTATFFTTGAFLFATNFDFT